MAKRVFFSFHYDDVASFRANTVRKHNQFKDVESAGYFDASIWESNRKTGATALKRLINSELNNTSVTAVLIGSETFERRWVRYEIAKSIDKGNLLLGIHINGIKDKYGLTKNIGENPFDYMAYQFNSDGTKVTNLMEEKNGNWIVYSDLDVSFNLKNPVDKKYHGGAYRLSVFNLTKNWVTDDGYKNFPSWIS